MIIVVPESHNAVVWITTAKFSRTLVFHVHCYQDLVGEKKHLLSFVTCHKLLSHGTGRLLRMVRVLKQFRPSRGVLMTTMHAGLTPQAAAPTSSVTTK